MTDPCNQTTLGCGMSDEEQVRISRACNPLAMVPETTGAVLRRVVRRWLIVGLMMLTFLLAVGLAQIVWEITQHV